MALHLEAFIKKLLYNVGNRFLSKKKKKKFLEAVRPVEIDRKQIKIIT